MSRRTLTFDATDNAFLDAVRQPVQFGPWNHTWPLPRITPGWLDRSRERCSRLLKTPFGLQSYEPDRAFQLARIYFPQ